MFSVRIGVAYTHKELIIKVLSIKLFRNSFSIPTLRLQEAALTSSLNKPVEGEQIGRQFLLNVGIRTWPRQAPLVIYFKVG